MRKSSVLLGAILIGTFCATAWWQMGSGNEQPAIPEPRLAESVPPLATPPPAHPSTATSAPSAALPVDAVNPSPAASKAQWIRREEDLVRLRAMHEEEEYRRASDPEYRKAQDEGRRRDAERTRAEAMRVARMTPEQVDRMFELGAERVARLRELVDTSHGRTFDDVSADASRLQSDYDAQLRELLEPEKYERWDWYNASQSERLEAKQFQAELTRNGGQPLHPDQVDQLVEALYTEEKRRNSEYEQYVRSTGISDPDKVPPRSNEWQLARGTASNQRVHDAMAGTLTPYQMSSLDKMLARKLAYIEEAIRYNASLPKPK